MDLYIIKGHYSPYIIVVHSLLYIKQPIRAFSVVSHRSFDPNHGNGSAVGQSPATLCPFNFVHGVIDLLGLNDP